MMSDDNYSGELHAWIEPEIEARIVAMVLGEASEFEQEELARLMEERPEVAAFKRRLEATDALVRDCVKPEDDAKWKLSPTVREQVLAALGEERPEPVVILEPEPKGTKTRQLRRSLLSLAACLILLVGLAALTTPAVFKSLKMAPQVYHSMSDYEDEAPMSLETPEPRGILYAKEKSLDEANFRVDSKSNAFAPAKSIFPVTPATPTEFSSDLNGAVAEVEVIRESTFPNEYEPPERPNARSVRKPSSGMAALRKNIQAGNQVAMNDSDESDPFADSGGGGGYNGEIGQDDPFGGNFEGGAVAALERDVEGGFKYANSVEKESRKRVQRSATPEGEEDPFADVASGSAIAARPSANKDKSGLEGLDSGLAGELNFGEADNFSSRGRRTDDDAFSDDLDNRKPGQKLNEKNGEHYAKRLDGRDNLTIAGKGASANDWFMKSAKDRKEKLQTGISGGEKRDITPSMPGMPIPQTDRMKPPSPDYLVKGLDGKIDSPISGKLAENGKSNALRIKTKHVEVTQANAEELGFDWVVGDEGKKAQLGIQDESFLGGGTAGKGEGRTAADFISPVDVAAIPGIPGRGNGQDVSNVVTAGNRSGDAAITRNSIDAILNNPVRSAGSGLKAGIDMAGGSSFTLDAQSRDFDGEAGDGILGVSGLVSDGALDEKSAIGSERRTEERDDLERRPSSSSSSFAQVAASTSPSPLVIPVPELVVPEPSMDFGDGDDFGAGWGAGGSGGGVEPDVDGLLSTESMSLLAEVSESGFKKDLSTLKRSARPAPVSGPVPELARDSPMDDRYAKGSSSKRAAITAGQEIGVPILGDLPGVGRLFKSKAEKKIAEVEVIDREPMIVDAKDSVIRREVAGEEDEKNLDLSLGSVRERESIRRQGLSSEREQKALGEVLALTPNASIRGATEISRATVDSLPAGSATEERLTELNAHLTDESVALAQDYRRKGRYEEAREVLGSVLKQNPSNTRALTDLENLDDPIRSSPALTFEHSADIDAVRRDLYKGEGFYNLGKFDEAQSHFEAVLRKDPYNSAARRWQERVNVVQSNYSTAAYDESRSRLLMEVDRAWAMGVPPEPDSPADLSGGAPLAGAFYIKDKFNGVIIPSIDFEDVSVEEALDFFRQRTRELDTTTINPADKGLNFVLQNGRSTVGGGSDSERRINLKLEGAKLGDAVRAVAEQAGLETAVDEYAIRLVPKGTAELASSLDLNKERSLKEGDVEKARNEAVRMRLQNIIIPMVDFENITVEEAVDFLRQRSRELDTTETDPSMRGINYVIRKSRIEGGGKGLDPELDAESGLGSDPGSARIDELKLRNVPLGTVLTYIADQAKLRYKIDDGVVTLLPLGGAEGEDLINRSFSLSPEMMEILRDSMGEDEALGTEGEEDLRDAPIRDLLMNSGITFPGDSSVSYLPGPGTLVVRNTPGNLDLADALVASLSKEVASKKRADKERELSAQDEPFSTFSLHVSDVSFKLAQAALKKGEWPEVGRIRSEEFVNAFDYGDPTPTAREKVACQVEQAVHPFAQQRNLVRVSMRTAATGRGAETPLRLTILLDNSGSMERVDRAESVARAFDLLSAQLHPQDEVTLISFARTPRLVRDRMTGAQAKELSQILRTIPSEGGTNLEAALALGVEKAKAGFVEGAQNRIILLTDGAANLGNARPEELQAMVEKMREQGIAFDACGVGADGLNDEILESLTRKGDGRYYFLDKPEDADEGFARQIAGALRPAAKNVKVQVEFNPDRVGRYKLYGFEKHELKKEDFRNDSVDAAEMAAEEAGVAMYQVETLPEGEGPVGTVSVRFQDVATGEMVERTWDIPYEAQPKRLHEADGKIRLAATAALLGERLKGSAVGEAVDLGELAVSARTLPTLYPHQSRVRQLVEMTERARGLAGE